MYSIQFSDWGLVLEFTGRIPDEMIRDWLGDVQQLTDGFQAGFGVILDLRGAQPESPIVSASILRGLVTLKRAGMVRAAAVVNDELGDPWAIPDAPSSVPELRSLRADLDDQWRKQAHDWVQHGVVPQSKRGSRDSNRRAASSQ